MKEPSSCLVTLVAHLQRRIHLYHPPPQLPDKCGRTSALLPPDLRSRRFLQERPGRPDHHVRQRLVHEEQGEEGKGSQMARLEEERRGLRSLWFGGGFTLCSVDSPVRMARPRMGRTYGHERRSDRAQYRVSPISISHQPQNPTQVTRTAEPRVDPKSLYT
jgi:hypothetical protein